MSLISNENKKALIARLKEFGFTVGFMIVAVGADFAAASIGLFNVDPKTAVLIGALLGQVASWAKAHYMPAIAGAYQRVAKAFKPVHRG